MGCVEVDSELVERPLPQFVSSATCFRCDVCCRFPDQGSFLRPYFTREEIAEAVAHGLPLSFFPDTAGSQINLVRHPTDEGYLCPAFDPRSGQCGIYDLRPLDCQLYPFALMWDATGEQVVLGWDTKCPFMRDAVPDTIRQHADYVAALLTTDRVMERLVEHTRLIGRFQDDVVILKPLPELTARLCPPPVDPRLRPLTVSDAPRFAKALSQTGMLQSDVPAAFAFPYHYVWTSLLPYWWLELDDTWFLFAQSADGWFMPLPPLGARPVEQTAEEAFRLMTQWNGSSPVSRIENLTALQAQRLEDNGTPCRRTGGDYVYVASALAALKGDRYKSQRALCNRAEREGALTIEPYRIEHQEACVHLQQRWVSQKHQEVLDPMGKLLLEDATAAHLRVLTEHERIGLLGTVVKAQDVIVAYTFGYWLTPQTWCVLLEVADRSLVGLSQWLFRETCRVAMAQGAISINAMDDAGLPGLRQAKQAYHPTTIIETWVATRSHTCPSA